MEGGRKGGMDEQRERGRQRGRESEWVGRMDG